MGCFIGGLKEEIRLEVKLKKPRNLVDAMGMARLVEDKQNLQRNFPLTLDPPGLIIHNLSLA